MHLSGVAKAPCDSWWTNWLIQESGVTLEAKVRVVAAVGQQSKDQYPRPSANGCQPSKSLPWITRTSAVFVSYILYTAVFWNCCGLFCLNVKTFLVKALSSMNEIEPFKFDKRLKSHWCHLNAKKQENGLANMASSKRSSRPAGRICCQIGLPHRDAII